MAENDRGVAFFGGGGGFIWIIVIIVIILLFFPGIFGNNCGYGGGCYKD